MAQPNLSSFTWSNLTIFGKGICKRLSVWSRKANESPLPGWKESFMDMPLWFANLVFWSVQVALLVLAAGLLAGALKLRQPRVLFPIGGRSSRRACYSRLCSPGIAHTMAHRWLSPLTLLALCFLRH